MKDLSLRRGVSVAELIREGIERILAESDQVEKWQQASTLIGRYTDAAPDVAVDHDRYLDEPYRG